MKRSKPPARRTPLARGAPPARRTARKRTAATSRRTPSRRAPAAGPAIPLGSARRAGAASEAQRAKIIGAACVVCGQTKGLTPAHLAPRAMGGCDHPACVVPMCWLHHRAHDTGRLELLAHLEPRWRTEIAHAVTHLGLIGAYRRLTGGRLPAADAAYAVDDGSR
jgi:hypothetical protein